MKEENDWSKSKIITITNNDQTQVLIRDIDIKAVAYPLLDSTLSSLVSNLWSQFKIPLSCILGWALLQAVRLDFSWDWLCFACLLSQESLHQTCGIILFGGSFYFMSHLHVFLTFLDFLTICLKFIHSCFCKITIYIYIYIILHYYKILPSNKIRCLRSVSKFSNNHVEENNKRSR